MKQATFFVGANNETGKVDTDKVVELVSTHFGGGTITPSTGIWQGQTEESVTVIVGHNKSADYIHFFVCLMADELNQDAIGVSDGQTFNLVNRQ